jgi:hypothetical protein
MTGTQVGAPPEPDRIDDSGLKRSLTSMEAMRVEMGATPADLIALDVEIARESLMEAMQIADRLGATEEHRQVADRVLALDDLMSWLSERSGHTEGES